MLHTVSAQGRTGMAMTSGFYSLIVNIFLACFPLVQLSMQFKDLTEKETWERSFWKAQLVKHLLSSWFNNSLFSRDAFAIVIVYFDYLQSASLGHNISPAAYE